MFSPTFLVVHSDHGIAAAGKRKCALGKHSSFPIDPQSNGANSRLHTEDYRGVSTNSAVTAARTVVDPNITPSRYGDIHTKYRKMIVVACHEQVSISYH